MGIPTNVCYCVFAFSFLWLLAAVAKYRRRNLNPVVAAEVQQVPAPEPEFADAVIQLVPKKKGVRKNSKPPFDASQKDNCHSLQDRELPLVEGGSDNSSQWSKTTAELLHLSSSESEVEGNVPVKRNIFRDDDNNRNESGWSNRIAAQVPRMRNAVDPNVGAHRITSHKLPDVARSVPTSTSVRTSKPCHATPTVIPRLKYADNDESRLDADRFTGWLQKDGGVRKTVDTAGSGTCPGPQSIVKYIYKIAKNAQFKCPLLYAMDDATTSNLESGEMIEGLRLGLLSMQCGERAVLRIEPKYGYGLRKSDTLKISSKDVIYIFIQLLDIAETSAAQLFIDTDVDLRWSRLSAKQVADAGDQLHLMGKEVFRQGQYSQAKQHFLEALAAKAITWERDDIPGFPSQRKTVEALLLCNSAVCCVREEKWEEVVKHGQKILDMKADRPSVAKACYLLAKAAFAKGEAQDAADFLERGLLIIPDQPDLSTLLKVYKAAAVKAKEESKRLFQKMFSAVQPTSPLSMNNPFSPNVSLGVSLKAAEKLMHKDNHAVVPESALMFDQKVPAFQQPDTAVTPLESEQAKKYISQAEFLVHQRQPPSVPERDKLKRYVTQSEFRDHITRLN